MKCVRFRPIPVVTVSRVRAELDIERACTVSDLKLGRVGAHED